MTKRTRLKARYVIGHEPSGHVIWENGEVVFSGSTIEFVGRGFDGAIDEDIDCGNAVAGPGFIDLDALGDIDSTVLAFDNGPYWTLGREWSRAFIAKGPAETFTPEEELFKYRYAFTQLIRNGITTAMPITSMTYRAWAESYDEFAQVAALAGAMGIRAYLGPCYKSGTSGSEYDGTPFQHWDEERAAKGLSDARRFIADFDGAHGGLIRACLTPDRIETCTPALLSASRDIIRDTGVPMRLHCCQSLYEVRLVQKLRGTTPYGWLYQLGLLNERAILPHGIYMSGHPAIGDAGVDDMALLTASGATVVHCPIVFARDGEALNSFADYAGRGINMAMGTDTCPPDMVDNLRQGLSICRIVSGKADAASAAAFYSAATLGGAKALGRADLGRLAKGAQADITVFDLDGLHLGPIIDPVKTMVLSGSGRDFRDCWIAGRRVMENRRLPGIDDDMLRREGQRLFEKLKASYPPRAPGTPTVEELFRSAFPVR